MTILECNSLPVLYAHRIQGQASWEDRFSAGYQKHMSLVFTRYVFVAHYEESHLCTDTILCCFGSSIFRMHNALVALFQQSAEAGMHALNRFLTRRPSCGFCTLMLCSMASRFTAGIAGICVRMKQAKQETIKHQYFSVVGSSNIMLSKLVAYIHEKGTIFNKLHDCLSPQTDTQTWSRCRRGQRVQRGPTACTNNIVYMNASFAAQEHRQRHITP